MKMACATASNCSLGQQTSMFEGREENDENERNSVTNWITGQVYFVCTHRT